MSDMKNTRNRKIITDWTLQRKRLVNLEDIAVRTTQNKLER